MMNERGRQHRAYSINYVIAAPVPPFIVTFDMQQGSARGSASVSWLGRWRYSDFESVLVIFLDQRSRMVN